MSFRVQVLAGRDPLTGRKRWLSRQVRGQSKAAWREAEKVEAQLLEQLDRGEQRGSEDLLAERTRVENRLRWLPGRQPPRRPPASIALDRDHGTTLAGHWSRCP